MNKSGALQYVLLFLIWEYILYVSFHMAHMYYVYVHAELRIRVFDKPLWDTTGPMRTLDDPSGVSRLQKLGGPIISRGQIFLTFAKTAHQ